MESVLICIMFIAALFLLENYLPAMGEYATGVVVFLFCTGFAVFLGLAIRFLGPL
jgi:hypothetical protein